MIEPATEVVQPDFGRQARLHAPQDVGALLLQPKHLQEAIMHGCDDLAQGRQPPPQAFWPAMWTLLLRLGDDQRPLGAPPPQAHLLAGKTGISDIAVIQRVPNGGQARLLLLPGRKQCFGQEVVSTLAWPQAKPGDRAHPADDREQLEAHEPAHPIAPAQRSLSSEPAAPPAFGVAHRNSHAWEDFLARAGLAHLLAQCQGESHDGIVVRAHQTIELTAFWQGRKGRAQVAQRVAIKGALALELAPLTPSAPRSSPHLGTALRLCRAEV